MLYSQEQTQKPPTPVSAALLPSTPPATTTRERLPPHRQTPPVAHAKALGAPSDSPRTAKGRSLGETRVTARTRPGILRCGGGHRQGLPRQRHRPRRALPQKVRGDGSRPSQGSSQGKRPPRRERRGSEPRSGKPRRPGETPTTTASLAPPRSRAAGSSRAIMAATSTGKKGAGRAGSARARGARRYSTRRRDRGSGSGTVAWGSRRRAPRAAGPDRHRLPRLETPLASRGV